MTNKDLLAITDEDILVIQAGIIAEREKRTPKREKRITNKYGQVFVRKIIVKGRPYWQRVRYVYFDGGRKLQIVEHLGNRKPRK